MHEVVAVLPTFFAATTGSAAGEFVSSLVFFGVTILIFYWFFIRPQSLKQKETEAMLSALKKNDRVLTSAGIYGTVSTIKDREVTLRVDDKTGAHLTVRRDAVVQIIEPAPGDAKPETLSSTKSDADDAGSSNGKKKK